MDEKDLVFLNVDTILNERYLIKDVLGIGGFGITYRAEDTLLGIDVAVKEFFPRTLVIRNHDVSNDVSVSYGEDDETFEGGKKKFLTEAKVAAKFQTSSGIVSVTDFFEANNTVYIVMEYVSGITLKKYMKEYGLISPEDMLELLLPLFECLEEVHDAGLIHRDISPDNIMMLPGGKIKLMDFGAARDYTGFGDESLSIVLKHGYAPPEQYQSKGVQGPWTDIYALCATIYLCITGHIPENSIQRVMRDQLKKPSEYGIEISPQIENTLMKGLSVSVEDRYQNLREFYADLYADYIDSVYADPKRGFYSVTPEKIREKKRGNTAGTALTASGTASDPTAGPASGTPRDSFSDNNSGMAPDPTSGDKKTKSDPKEKGGIKADKKIIAAAAALLIIAIGGVGMSLQNGKSGQLKTGTGANSVVESTMQEGTADTTTDAAAELKAETPTAAGDAAVPADTNVGAAEPPAGNEPSGGQEPSDSNISETVAPSLDDGDAYIQEIDTFEEEEESESMPYVNTEVETPALVAAKNNSSRASVAPVGYKDHAYAVFNFKTLNLDGFNECEAFCRGVGGHMAVISSREENDFIFKYLKENDDGGNPHAFFGFTDQDEEGEWKWVDGSPVTYTNWCRKKGKKQPNNKKGKEHYARYFGEVNDGTWNDASFGDTSYLFVCEWE